MLARLLDDVDRVVVNVNIYCRLIWPEEQKERGRKGERHEGAESVARVYPIPLMAGPREPDYVPEDYREPVLFEYYYAVREYLGSVALLRGRDNPPISERSVALVQALEPFMVFALSDMVARYSYAKPINRVFRDVVQAIANETHLTRRELEVLGLHLLGWKYEEIARRLYISIDTVKKHVKRIHRKTGARGAIELFARYFAPLIDLGTIGSDDGL